MYDFIPVLLGTDNNVYGTARSFHELYGVRSVALGCEPLRYTRASKIVSVETTPDFDTPEVFLDVMLRKGKELSATGKKLLLMPCGDGYTELIILNRGALSEYFLFNVIDREMQVKLENKKAFYAICEKYGLDYPATLVLTYEDRHNYEVPFDFPVALKPNDSIEYLHTRFEGKKKAYKIASAEEYREVVDRIYNSTYRGDLIVQDFIPGDSSKMYVLNAYVNTAGKVKMMCFGKCLLDECLPMDIGNYNALVSMGNDAIYRQYETFLETIGYRGYANFDLKLDDRDGKYKVFEINLRQGRSSYYMTAGGCNFVKYIVDDLILGKNEPPHYHAEEGLWLYCDPLVVKKYCNPVDRPLVDKMLKRGFKFTQWYENDRSLTRFLDYWRRRLSTIKYYRKFQPERMND